MRKATWWIALVLVMSCLAIAPAAGAKGRTEKRTYSFDPSNGGSFSVSDDTTFFGSAETLTFETARADRTVALTVTDESAPAVAAETWQGDGPSTVFCNEIASLPVKGGKPLYVRVIVALSPVGEDCASPEVPTTGTVTATFTGGEKARAKGHQHHH